MNAIADRKRTATCEFCKRIKPKGELIRGQRGYYCWPTDVDCVDRRHEKTP